MLTVNEDRHAVNPNKNRTSLIFRNNFRKLGEPFYWTLTFIITLSINLAKIWDDSGSAQIAQNNE